MAVGLLRGAALAAVIAPCTAQAQAACRLALLLGLDVSASVDAAEYALQSEGLARALTAPRVARLLLAGADNPVALAVFEWSGPDEQAVILDWTAIRTPADLAGAAALVRAHERSAFLGKTGLGGAMIFAGTMFASAPECTARTLDISGDGKSNTGPAPEQVHAAGALAGVTVNALAVGREIPIDMPGDPSVEDTLDVYFAKAVIRGAGSFVQNTLTYDGYADAMTAKLERELGGLVMGELQ